MMVDMTNDEVETEELRGRTEKDLVKRTKTFALRIIYLFSALPKSTLAQVLGTQVLRSGTSVGANYREAHRSRSKLEFISKIGDCLKELDETAYWLELLDESAIIPSAKLSALRDECNQLLAIFTTISKNTKKGMMTNHA
jgi:four helix bundle protein